MIKAILNRRSFYMHSWLILRAVGAFYRLLEMGDRSELVRIFYPEKSDFC